MANTNAQIKAERWIQEVGIPNEGPVSSERSESRDVQTDGDFWDV